ncbi:leucine-rich repeat transmembrane protein FLRT1-like [Mya arenaria]|uniref:leucine-rich repeat transmembrane protein FLRT1-like n=1 Tax=Mya arenaria TaxID=6604 RepID=UPI0022E94C4F|nr:leucine-rich repeat transmembrane protein FLRT1-like [Mya arenaria]
MNLKLIYAYVCVTLLISRGALAAYAPTGCTFSEKGNNKATCDFRNWEPPLIEKDFGPGDVISITVEKVDGTIPSLAFSGIDNNKNISRGVTAELTFKCDLENILLSDNVFTIALSYIEKLTFESCYVQNGISSFMLSNLTSLEELTVDGGIIGPLTSDSFSGLSNLKRLIIRADFLDTDIPSGLFSGIQTLEEIDLRSSGISSMAADTFTGLEYLETLDLSGNSLTSLPEDLFQSLKSLTSIELGTNAWHCTCDLAWLATWSLYTDVNIDVTCTSPASYAGLTLGRAVAVLGCVDSVQTVTTSSEDASSSSSEERRDVTAAFLQVDGEDANQYAT